MNAHHCLSPRVRRTLRITATLLSAALINAPRHVAAQSLALADKAFTNSDWIAASREYRAIARNDSTDMRAHFRLAIALFELEQLQEAVPLFARAVTSGFQVPMAEFRQTRAFARLGRIDDALEHLERAAAAGVTVELIRSHPDIEPLRKQPRYTTLVDRMENARYPCRASEEAHQFDFWIGEWSVTPWSATGESAPEAGRNRVSIQLEHCLLMEEWTPTAGPGGKSFNFWDSNRRKWRQVWASADGNSLDYEGEFRDSAMRFSGWTRDSSGKRVLQKLTFLKISADTVRQVFEESADEGRTWRITFDGRYVRLEPQPRVRTPPPISPSSR